MKAQRNMTLEIVKLFAAYMVVFIHITFAGDLGVVMDALARFAVPLFFLVSGYFSYNISPEKIIKRIKYIFSLLIFTSILYTLFNIAVRIYYGSFADVVIYFAEYFKPQNLCNLFIFNVPISSGHIWYLLAVIYIYIIYYFIVKYEVKEKVLLIISIVLLITHLILGEGLSAFGIVLPINFLRNFALMGFPFFTIGLWSRRNHEKIKNIKIPIIIISALVGIILTIFSRYLFGANELHIGSIFILFSLICLTLKYAHIKYPKCFRFLTDLSTYIYIIHILVSYLIYILYGMLNINLDFAPILKFGHPIIVCIISTFVSFIITKTLAIIKRKTR